LVLGGFGLISAHAYPDPGLRDGVLSNIFGNYIPNQRLKRDIVKSWDVELGNSDGQVVVAGSKVIIWVKAKVEETGYVYEDINASNGTPVSSKLV